MEAIQHQPSIKDEFILNADDTYHLTSETFVKKKLGLEQDRGANLLSGSLRPEVVEIILESQGRGL